MRARPLKAEVNGRLVVRAVLRRILLEEGLAVRRVEVKRSDAAVCRDGNRVLGGALIHQRATDGIAGHVGGILAQMLRIRVERLLHPATKWRILPVHPGPGMESPS